jgi:hypothetical protein
MAGVDLRAVAELLGHRTLQMVMRYSHLAHEHQASAVDRLVKSENRWDTKSDVGASEAKERKTATLLSSRKYYSQQAERWQGPVDCT